MAQTPAREPVAPRPEQVTRRSLHGVAELLLAGPQHRRSGTIRLRATHGGFATTKEPAIAVDRGDLVYAGGRIAIGGHTCGAIASAAGVAAGAPEGLYAGGSGVELDEVLELDGDAATRLAQALTVGDEALRRLDPSQPAVLWPEHFDLGITLDEVNYGVSAGDSHLDEPYAYVGPWQPRQGSFWNAPFGAARPIGELSGVDAVAAFFTEGRDRARHGSRQP